MIFQKFTKGVPLMSMSVFAMKIKSAMSVLALFKNVRMYGGNEGVGDGTF